MKLPSTVSLSKCEDIGHSIPRWPSAGWRQILFTRSKHRREVCSLCLFYRLFNGECFEELVEVIPTSTFPVCIKFRCRNMFHPYCLDGNPRPLGMPDPSFTHEQTIPRTSYQQFPYSYHMGLFKGRINQFLKSWQRIWSFSGSANVYGWRYSLHINDPPAEFSHDSKNILVVPKAVSNHVRYQITVTLLLVKL